MSDMTVYDPTHEETEEAAQVLAEAMNKPCDGYFVSVAEDMLRAAAHVRLQAQARVKLAASCMDRVGIPDALIKAIVAA